MLYLVAPANFYTGGPTAIFQMCHFMRKQFGYPAIIAFTGAKEGIDPVHPNYKKYDCPWVLLAHVKDSKENVIIIPETMTNLLYNFTKSKKVVYWLSVDNFLLSRFFYQKRILSRVYNLFNFIEYCLGSLEYCFKIGLHWPKSFGNDIRRYTSCKEAYNFFKNSGLFFKNIDMHIVQSAYAMNFLLKAGVDKDKVFILREPLEDHFLNAQLDLKTKKNIITFNARKSFAITYKIISKIREYDKKIKIVPLENVGREKMLYFLTLSKVYVDIGFHPGRDRPIREAGVLGNIVIVNRSGGCYYFDDCPIPDKYAIFCHDITCRDINPIRIAQLIIDYINNYDIYINDFKQFIELIREEPEIYKRDLEVIVQQLTNMT